MTVEVLHTGDNGKRESAVDATASLYHYRFVYLYGITCPFFFLGGGRKFRPISFVYSDGCGRAAHVFLYVSPCGNTHNSCQFEQCNLDDVLVTVTMVMRVSSDGMYVSSLRRA